LPFEGEPSLEDIVDNVNMGDPETIVERMCKEICLVRPTHYSCFFCFGPMDGKRALKSMQRFGEEVLPLLERELGDLSRLNEPDLQPPAVAGCAV
ncbi:MAG: hypothetical protein V3T85_08800, partial [Acidiferrobacterales bacterium]